MSGFWIYSGAITEIPANPLDIGKDLSSLDSLDEQVI